MTNKKLWFMKPSNTSIIIMSVEINSRDFEHVEIKSLSMDMMMAIDLIENLINQFRVTTEIMLITFSEAKKRFFRLSSTRHRAHEMMVNYRFEIDFEKKFSLSLCE